jgi:hypothetical protein
MIGSLAVLFPSGHLTTRLTCLDLVQAQVTVTSNTETCSRKVAVISAERLAS